MTDVPHQMPQFGPLLVLRCPICARNETIQMQPMMSSYVGRHSRYCQHVSPTTGAITAYVWQPATPETEQYFDNMDKAFREQDDSRTRAQEALKDWPR